MGSFESAAERIRERGRDLDFQGVALELLAKSREDNIDTVQRKLALQEAQVWAFLHLGKAVQVR